SDSLESSEILQVLKDSTIISLEIPSHEFLTQYIHHLYEHVQNYVVVNYRKLGQTPEQARPFHLYDEDRRRNPSQSINRYSSKFNTISKRLFDKLKSDHRTRPTFGKYHSLDVTNAIYFKIRKNPPFDLVLGQDVIPLIEDGNKASSSKNNPFDSETETDSSNFNSHNRPRKNRKYSHFMTTSDLRPKPNLTLKELTKKLSLRSEDNKYQKRHHGIFHNMPPIPPTSDDNFNVFDQCFGNCPIFGLCVNNDVRRENPIFVVTCFAMYFIIPRNSMHVSRDTTFVVEAYHYATAYLTKSFGMSLLKAGECRPGRAMCSGINSSRCRGFLLPRLKQNNWSLDNAQEEIDQNLRALQSKLGASQESNSDASLYSALDPLSLKWKDPLAIWFLVMIQL
ncbi:1980_t:CDS:2, partial [Gigaspora rosea]